MAKEIKQMVDEVVNGKKQCVILRIDGVTTIYDDVVGWTLNGDWVAVMLSDGATEVWPASSVSFARHFTKE
jgi:hypothetical protein